MNSKDLKRHIRLSPVANSRIYHLVRFCMKQGGMNTIMKKAGIPSSDEKRMASLMKEAMVKYRWDFDECIMYHYDELTDSERKSFVPEYEKNIFCDRVNDSRQARFFDSSGKAIAISKIIITETVCGLKIRMLYSISSKGIGISLLSQTLRPVAVV